MAFEIGIDLGTTFSVIAVNGKVQLSDEYGDGTYLEECDVTVIPTPDGDLTFPSVIIDAADSERGWLFGHEAMAEALEGRAPIMFSKRKIGTSEKFILASGEVTAKDVARELLRHLKSCAEQALGEPVTRAAITHPAYFDRASVEETRLAAVEAGFHEDGVVMLMEPVAAALSFSRADDRDPLRILTYDLGGGTFDVTFLERREGVIQVLGFDGDHLMGGYNFDRELAHWIRLQVEARGRPVAIDETTEDGRGRIARLLQLAEGIKVKLATAKDDEVKVNVRSHDILIDADGRPIQVNERLTRPEFVALIQPHLDKAIECCRRTLDKAGAKPEELDEVVLVGGSSYGPWVAASIKEAFPTAEAKLFAPDLCVGAGAAVYAKLTFPPRAASDEAIVEVEAPDITPLDVISVSGTVARTDGQDPSQLQVSLRSGSAELGPNEVVNGRFYFPDIELNLDGPTEFVLSVRDEDGRTVVEHSFTSTYSPDDAQAAEIDTVLPRPLFVETAAGLVRLAEEGKVLPAVCEAEYQAQHQLQSLDLNLFQEGERVGQIIIESDGATIPAKSKIQLNVRVSARNEITASAEIASPEGEAVPVKCVQVVYRIPEIPSQEELQQWLQDLYVRFDQKVAGNPFLAGELGPPAVRLLEAAAKLMSQQPVERPEVLAVLKLLDNLLDPPDDPMNPSRFQILEEICKIRMFADMKLSGLRRVQSGSEDNGEKDESLAAKIKECEEQLAILETLQHAAPQVHQLRDRRSWAKIGHSLSEVFHRINETEYESAQQVKEAALRDVQREQRRLTQQLDAIARRGDGERWESAAAEMMQQLKALENDVAALDAELSMDQIRDEIMMLLSKRLDPLRNQIDGLGVAV
ncbi:MAG: Hsp70 family protein [Planctomycetales bacterium]|nr:Hsp70 family protein [Planctomycetales bacterium]